MIGDIVTVLVDSAEELLLGLGTTFTNILELFYDSVNAEVTGLGMIIVATAGFALAWSGIRFIFGFVNRLLNKSRAGR